MELTEEEKEKIESITRELITEQMEKILQARGAMSAYVVTLAYCDMVTTINKFSLSKEQTLDCIALLTTLTEAETKVMKILSPEPAETSVTSQQQN